MKHALFYEELKTVETNAFQQELQKASQLDFEFKMRKLAEEEQAALWKDKEIVPFGFNVMIKPTEENPYLRKITADGIITDGGGAFNNPDSGERDILERGIAYAVVLSVGPDVKHVRKGDEIITTILR